MTELKVFTATRAYEDYPEGGTWMGVVMAPDQFTADRLMGRQMLVDNKWTLDSEGYESFLDFYNSTDDINSWQGLNGNACPSCQSHDTDFAPEAGEYGEAKACNTCGYMWLPLGFEPNMQKSAAQAWQTIIDGLDDDEAASLVEPDEDTEHDPIDE
jgi:hypothetical protein